MEDGVERQCTQVGTKKHLNRAGSLIIQRRGRIEKKDRIKFSNDRTRV